MLKCLGIEGKERSESYMAFFNLLLEQEVTLLIFRHTYEEIHNILEDCIIWTENPNYDPRVASPATKYFVESQFKKTDVELFVSQFDSFLLKHKISVVEAPDPLAHIVYQVDEKMLHEMIKNRYKLSKYIYDDPKKDIVISRDVLSISYIYKLRKGKKPVNLKDSEHIFVTSNNSLSIAAKEYDEQEINLKSNIYCCLTDTFIGTLLWLYSPQKVISININNFIAQCYSSLKPDSELINKYISEVSKLKDSKTISSEEFFFLKTHRICYTMLQDITLGDPDNFNDQTIQEIRYEIEEYYSKNANEKLKIVEDNNKEKDDLLEKSKSEIIKLNDNICDQDRHLKFMAKKITDYSTLILQIVLGFIFVIGVGCQAVDITKTKTLNLQPFAIVAIILGITDMIFNINIYEIKNKFKVYLEKKLCDIFIKK